MNKLILMLLAGCLFTQAIAQNQTQQLIVNPYLGYELNLLKAPANYTSAQVVEAGISELWVNAPFAGAKLKWSLLRQNKKKNFGINVNYRRALFTAADNVNARDVSTSIYYKYSPSKKLKNNLKIGFRDYVKTGEDLDNLLGAPLSYRRFDFGNELKLKPLKNMELTLHPFSNLKMYQMTAFDRFLYFDNGINTGLTYRYNLKRKVGFALYGGMHQRNYFINKTGDDVEIEDEEGEDFVEIDSDNRVWRYFSSGLGVRMPINDRLKVITRLDYTNRLDLIQEKLGYNQYELSFDLSYKKEGFKLGLATAFMHRNYNNFGITEDGQRTLLKYTYIKETGYAKFALSDQLSLDFRALVKVRISNVNNVNRRAMRSYFIGETSIGLIWKIRAANNKQKQHYNL